MSELAITDTLTPALAKAAAAMDDWTPAMLPISGILEDDWHERFETGTAPDGTAWTPSLRFKLKGGKTLVERGHLREPGVAHDARSATAATNLIYARIHNDGGVIKAKGRAAGGAKALNTPFGPRGSVTMPQRTFVGFSAAAREDIGVALAAHLRANGFSDGAGA